MGRFGDWIKKLTHKDDLPKEPFFSQWVVFGSHHPTPSENMEVFFVGSAGDYLNQIVDRNGLICGFPGFENPEFVASYLEGGELPLPIVRYQAEFKKWRFGDYRMLWEIRPAGGEGREEIILYADICRLGVFRSSFKVYQVGAAELWRTKIEEEAARELYKKGLQKFIFCAVDYFIDRVQKDGSTAMARSIPNSGKILEFRLCGRERDRPNRFMVGVRRENSDVLHQYCLANECETKENVLQWLEKEEKKQKILDYVVDLSERVDRD